MNDYYECVRCRVQFERSTMEMITVLKDNKYYKVLICERCKKRLEEREYRRL